jgi:hypothetical protein
MKNTIKIIEENYFKGSQSINFEGFYKMNDFKLKIEIKKDSYTAQSYGRVWVWKDLEWSFIASIPPVQLNVVIANIYYGNDPSESTKNIFKKDIEILKTKSKNILN